MVIDGAVYMMPTIYDFLDTWYITVRDNNRVEIWTSKSYNCIKNLKVNDTIKMSECYSWSYTKIK